MPATANGGRSGNGKKKDTTMMDNVRFTCRSRHGRALTWIKIRIGRRRTIVIFLLSRVNPRDLEVIVRVAPWVLEFHRDFDIVYFDAACC